jgi:FkbM family methyltransferase
MYKILTKLLIYLYKITKKKIPSDKIGELEHTLLTYIFKNSIKMRTPDGDIKFTYTNKVSYWRYSTLYTKEKDTIRWINSFKKNCIFWDIGANIGIYSIYAAKVKNARVFSFEPSVFNLELLARNIFNNKLYDLITIIPLPISDNIKCSYFNMNSISYGSALSTFTNKIDKSKFIYQTISISPDFLKNIYTQDPNYIKIDVDGNEYEILNGMNNVLRSEHLLTISVEISNNFYDIANLLNNYNFYPISKQQHGNCIFKKT